MSGRIPTRRVALYARVSTRDKDQDPELQLIPLREYVAARGWEAVEYVDHAPAGDLAHRTAWRQLRADATRRRFELLMVWKLDRAFRSTLDALSTLGELEHRSVGFASLTQPELDTTSPTGRLVFTILSAVAEMERSLISDRVKEGMKLAASRGARIGRPKVTDRPAFTRKWPGVRAQVLAGALSQRKAARDLRIGVATLKRMLDADAPPLQKEVSADATAGAVCQCELGASKPTPYWCGYLVSALPTGVVLDGWAPRPTRRSCLERRQNVRPSPPDSRSRGSEPPR